MKTMYNGYPLSVELEYKSGDFIIYDKVNKKYSRRYKTFDSAKKHAQGWNRAYKLKRKR